jgi:hypothetical protein
MAKEELIIINKLELPDGDIVVGMKPLREELKDEWKNIDMADLKRQFLFKNITIIGQDYQFEVVTRDVDILNSIAGFKNVFVRLENNPDTREIEENDKAEIDL